MPNKEKKQKVSSEAGSESGGQKKKRSRTKAQASDADSSDMPNIAKPWAKKCTKAANNAKPLAAADVVEEELVEDTASEAGSSHQTTSPWRSPIKRAQGK